MTKARVPLKRLKKYAQKCKGIKKAKTLIQANLRHWKEEIEWTEKLLDKMVGELIPADLIEAWELSLNLEDYKPSLAVPDCVQELQLATGSSILCTFLKEQTSDYRFFTVVPDGSNFDHKKLTRKHPRRALKTFTSQLNKHLKKRSMERPQGSLFVVVEACPKEDLINLHLHALASGDWVPIIAKLRKQKKYRNSDAARKPFWAKKLKDDDEETHLSRIISYMLKFRTYEKRSGVNNGNPIWPSPNVHASLLSLLHELKLEDVLGVTGGIEDALPSGYLLLPSSRRNKAEEKQFHPIWNTAYWTLDSDAEHENEQYWSENGDHSCKAIGTTAQVKVTPIPDLCGNMWEHVGTKPQLDEFDINGLESIRVGKNQHGTHVYAFFGRNNMVFETSNKGTVLKKAASDVGARLHSRHSKTIFEKVLDDVQHSFECCHISKAGYHRTSMEHTHPNIYTSRSGWVLAVGGEISNDPILTFDSNLSFHALPSGISNMDDFAAQLSGLINGDPVLLTLLGTSLIPAFRPLVEASGPFEDFILSLFGEKEMGKTTYTRLLLNLIYGAGGWTSATWNATDNGAEQLLQQSDGGILHLDETGVGGKDADITARLKFLAHTTEQGIGKKRFGEEIPRFHSQIISTTNLDLIKISRKHIKEIRVVDALFSRVLTLDVAKQRKLGTIQERVRSFDELAQRYNGALEPIIVKAVLEQSGIRGDNLQTRFSESRQRIHKKIKDRIDPKSISDRQIRRMEVVFGCLECAIETGILSRDILGNVSDCLLEILIEQGQGIGPVEIARHSNEHLSSYLVDCLIGYSGKIISVKPGDFPEISNKSKNTKVVCKKTQNGKYKFIFSSLKLLNSVVSNFDEIKQSLLQKGFLHVNRKRGWQSKERFRLTENNYPENVYVIVLDQASFKEIRTVRRSVS